MFQIKEELNLNKRVFALLALFLVVLFGSAGESFAQRQPPGARTPIGVLNGQPIYADKMINNINNDSPFMPALEDDKLTTTATPNPNATPVPSPLHFARLKSFGRRDVFGKPLLVTEGALKADVVTNLHSKFFPIANGGVSCAQELIVSTSRGKDIYLAFDNDYHENTAVVRQLARLLKLRLIDSRENNLTARTKLLSWSQSSKGIDDALLRGEKLDELTVADWLSVLQKSSREEVGKFREISNLIDLLKSR